MLCKLISSFQKYSVVSLNVSPMPNQEPILQKNVAPVYLHISKRYLEIQVPKNSKMLEEILPPPWLPTAYLHFCYKLKIDTMATL